MKIAITGTRGIPNHYGGFEQFAEELSVRLVKKGHEVLVYNPEENPYKKKTFEKVNIVVKKALFKSIPQLSTLIYDFVCLRDALKKKPDAILELRLFLFPFLQNFEKSTKNSHYHPYGWDGMATTKMGEACKSIFKMD